MAKDILGLLSSSVSKPKPKKPISRAPVLSDSDFAAQWKVTGSHLVSNVPSPDSFEQFYNKNLSDGSRMIKVAAFDMDSTLIKSISGLKFGRGAHDWQWWNNQVVSAIKQKVEEKYVIAIFTNQGSTVVLQNNPSASKSYLILRSKINQIAASLKNIVDAPILVFAATQLPGKKHRKICSSEETHKRTRKPEIGMWEELLRYLKLSLGEEIELDMKKSFFVGDAAGREGDFLDSDKKFAENIGILFEVPDTFFAEEQKVL